MSRRPTRMLALALVLALRALPLAAAAPGEVTGLRPCPASPGCMQWDVDATATDYLLYRGPGRTLPALLDAAPDSCLAGNFTGAVTGPAVIADPAGGLYWYLATARNGGGEGPPGNATTGPHVLNSVGLCCNEPVYRESFTGADGSAWPFPFTPIGGVLDAGQSGGRGRWRPVLNSYSLARIYADYREQDVEALFTIEFGDIAHQGMGFYVRSNGHYLQSVPATPGQGYAVFVEGFRNPQQIGLWKEQGGVESPFFFHTYAAGTLQNGVRYRVRFRVTQSDPATTLLQAKLWPESGAEPAPWDATWSDSLASLQNVSGGYAVDSYSSLAGGPPPAYLFVDDIQVTRLCGVSPP